jgi:peptidoglycan/LPS O-acetylase OafA/YrhL
VFPLNFYRFFPNMFLPQTWSLGLEAFFYVLFPFVLIFRVRKPVAIASFVVFLLAYFGVLDTDLYGYRYLPGTFFIFICGSWMECPEDKIDRLLPWAVWGIAILLLLLQNHAFSSHSVYESLIRRSVLSGLTIGIPLVFCLKNKGSSGLAGDLSYGVFLNHVLIIGAISSFTSLKLTGLNLPMSVFAFILVCSIATMASYVSFRTVEEPFIRLRRLLRGGKATISKHQYMIEWPEVRHGIAVSLVDDIVGKAITPTTAIAGSTSLSHNDVAGARLPSGTDLPTLE